MDFCSIYRHQAAAAAVSQSFNVIHYHYSVSTLLMNAEVRHRNAHATESTRMDDENESDGCDENRNSQRKKTENVLKWSERTT